MTEGDQPSGQSSTAVAAMCGDRQALASLWQEHRRWVAAVILAYKPRSADLEDLLQDVAMTLVSRINTVRDESNVKAWLRVVAVNAARAAGRSMKLRPATMAGDLGSIQPAAPIDDRAELSDHSRLVMDLARDLPEAYREPLLLKALQGMRTRQIAEILDIPEATVDTRISRARRMLRDMIDSRPGARQQQSPGQTRLVHENGRERAQAVPVEVRHE